MDSIHEQPTTVPDSPSPGPGPNSLGQDLLPKWGSSQSWRLPLLLSLAYRSPGANADENLGIWEAVRKMVPSTITERLEEVGLTAPPFNWDALTSRISIPHPPSNALDHVRLIQALLTNYQQRFEEHIRYRLSTGGNVHFEITGPTGMGKSSCAVSLADWISHIEPEELENHLSIDVTDLPEKLRNKKPGQTVVQDEYVQLAGEGAATVRGLFQNLEDTLRASQVNLLVLSPRRQDHGTMQAVLELIAWNPKKRFSAFLVWIDDVPQGLIAIPWMRNELYEVYAPWKQHNVERTMRGQFRDNTYIARMAVGLCRDHRFVHFLSQGINKPKPKDFETAVEFFHPQMMSGGQAERLARFLHMVCYGWDRIEKHFEEWFGIQPNDGLRKVAMTCYQE